MTRARTERRAAARAARRRGLTAEAVHRAAQRPPTLAVVSVDVPAHWRPHFDNAADLAGRLDPDELVGCEVFAAWEPGGPTVVTVVPTASAVETLRQADEGELAELLAVPLPGRHRLVMMPPGEEAHVYGFWIGPLSPGGVS